MLTAADFIRLPFTPDLTEGGIAFALHSLPFIYDRIKRSPFDRLRRTAAQAAAGLAVRRHLTGQGIPFRIKETEPFSDPECYEVLLGGHRCTLQTFLISHPEQIAAMQADPALVLKAPALVPSDRHARGDHGGGDLYLFAFLEGRVAASLADLKEVLESGGRHYLLHCLPGAWVRPRDWRPLGPLSLKSESEAPLAVQLTGQDGARAPLSCTVELPGRTRVVVREPFFSLTSIHIDRPLECRLGIHSPRMGEPYLVHWHEWGNLWIQGAEILLAGYLPRLDFGSQAVPLPPGARVFQFSETQVKNLALPVSSLRPVAQLFEGVKAWGEGRGSKQ